MPDLMVVFLGWNSNFEKKVRGAYYNTRPYGSAHPDDDVGEHSDPEELCRCHIIHNTTED